MMIIFSTAEGEEQVDSAVLNNEIPDLHDYIVWDAPRSNIPKGKYSVERVIWDIKSLRISDSVSVRIQLAPVP